MLRGVARTLALEVTPGGKCQGTGEPLTRSCFYREAGRVVEIVVKLWTVASVRPSSTLGL